MKGLKETLTSILAAMGVELPPWLAPLIMLALAAMAFPWFRKNERTKRARRMIQASADLPFEERAVRQTEALDLVTGHAYGLLAVAEEASKRGMRTTALEALARLQAIRKAPLMDLRKLEKKLLGPAPTTLEGAIDQIQESRNEGRFAEAKHHLRRARRRWPSAQPLMDLDVERSLDVRR